MSISSQAAQAMETNLADDAVAADCELEVSPHRGRVRRLAERGLTTIEYAIGLVAAATAALVLLRIFNDNAFFQALFDWVLGVFKLMTS
ncbi:DUF4244 domain-containing protein [Tessaracoccus sp. OS52]|uniref:DUF4244 domain-containing protein n=1 Tax=Tessaracoccus sp. OS52 TaxID=2886691 RepID=UPI001D116D50|nr:DUF4244 domain-containing protein [Tessaracoccus sp. OS52]MCC2594388.1 DUF4244 domain-containing protein [Tessaracoccus sp. OS52]